MSPKQEVIQVGYPNGGFLWMHKKEYDAQKRHMRRGLADAMYRMAYDTEGKGEKRRELNRDNRKWAMIKVGNTQMLAWVDTETMRAYKADEYKPTWIEWTKYTFIRWATTFDL